MAAPAQAATADESAEETSFTLAQPVDLQAGHSETLPIVDKDVPAERVDLASYGQAHPFSSIRVHNDTGLSLPAGVLTLYESRTAVGFVGDARLGGLPAGQVRLLSFAQDLRTSVDATQTTAPSVVSAFSVADGVLTYVQRFRQVFRISVTAPANEPRSVLLAIPKANGNQTLTIAQGAAKAEETTESAWRLAMSLKPGETQAVTVYLDQPARQTTALLAGDDQLLQLIVGNDHIDQAGRAALRHLIDLRRDEARKRAEIDSLNKTLDGVQADEDRLRQNLAAVSAGDALRSRLTKALDADETRIDQLRAAIADATSAAEKAHKALADAIASLRI